MSDDPSQVDTATLAKSIIHTTGEARGRIIEAMNFLQTAMAAAWEIERRAKALAAATLPADPVEGPHGPP